MRSRISFLLGCLTAWQLCGADGLQAQPASEPLTLADAVARAVASYPAVQISTEQRAEAAAAVALSRSTFLPRADLVWQANRNNVSGSLLPQMVIGSLTGPVTTASAETAWNHAAGALVTWEPIDFGARGAAVRSARAGQLAADAGLELTQAQVASAAADAWLAARAAEERLRAGRAGVERARTVFDVVDARARAGLRPGADASRARAELAAAETALAVMERDVAIARAELAQWVDVPAAALQLVPLTTAMKMAVTADLGVESSPAVRQQAAHVAAAEAAQTAVARSLAPRIFIEGTAFTRQGGFGADGIAGSGGQTAHNWAAGVNVTVPLFDWSAQGARRAAEQARVQQAGARYDAALIGVRAGQLKAQADLEASRRIAELAVPQLDAARAADEQARARYSSGLGTIAEVADAGRLLTDAEVTSAVAAINLARAAVARAAAGGTLQSVTDAVRALEGR